MFPCDSLEDSGIPLRGIAKDSDRSAGAPDADTTAGLLSGLLADENEFDRGLLWRIGAWGFAALGAVIVAVTANQSSLGWRREQVAAADLAHQTQQIQLLARESQNETRRLASAIDTLNNDRDRLYSRLTVLEQGLDSVTGAIAKQSAAASGSAPAAAAPNGPAAAAPASDGQAAPPLPSSAPAPAVASVATTPAPALVEKPREAKPISNVAMAVLLPAPTPASAAPAAAPAALGPTKSIMSPPDPAAPKMVEAPKPPVAAIAPPLETPQPAATETATPKAEIKRTEFAVDLGSASSIGGLRALWRGILKSNADLATLHPIIVVKESTSGLGMQLHLAAGPLQDAAAAAKICAALLESQRACETTVFDGQRLAMAADDTQPVAGAKAPPAFKPVKRGYDPRHSKKDDPPPKPEPATLSSWFGTAKH
jgi:hypothetical protein